MAPYTGYVLIAVALLFAQAICDLTLPDYMSDIVNTGVIDSNIPYIWQVGGKFVFPDNKDDMEYHYERGFDDVFTKDTDLPFPSFL